MGKTQNRGDRRERGFRLVVFAVLAGVLVLVPTGAALADDTGWLSPFGSDYGFGESTPNGFSVAAAMVHSEVGADEDTVSAVYWDFSIPDLTGQAIDGIEVLLYGVERPAYLPFYQVELTWDGGMSWTAPKNAPLAQWPAGGPPNNFVLGGPTDLWGHSWTPSEVTSGTNPEPDNPDDNFRVRLTHNDGGTDHSTDLYFDWVALRIYYHEAPVPIDTDGDGITDDVDNCPTAPNTAQADNYGTAAGDACEDTDSDTVVDEADNCPLVQNPDQADNYGTAAGDACEPAADALLADLADQVGELGLTGGTARSLAAQLDSAAAALERGNETVTVNTLEAFINHVEAQAGKKIPRGDADALIAATQAILSLLPE
jgi:hypothetical protein